MRGFEQIVNKNLIKSCGYLNGKFTKGTATGVFDLINPANGKVLTQLPRMGVKDAEDGAKFAADAFNTWKHTTGKERSKILRNMFELMSGKYRDDLAAIITLEAGKPLSEAKGEVGYAASFYELYAEEAKRVSGEVLTTPNNNRRLLALKQPVGPAALVTPWNFPSAMITRKVGPALAAGCTVLIKPAEQTPLSALALCVIAEEAGLPAGVMNCLTVGREEVLTVGTSLCHSKLIRKLSFTGSTVVGKWLMKECSTTMKKISMELGGNAPFIVFDDADLDVALAALMAAKFRNAGQACIASNRILVQEGVYDKFADMLTAAAGKIVCGDGFGKDITMGPLINAQGLQKVVSQVKDSVEKGAKVTVGGTVHQELNAAGGFFHMPTVMTGVTKHMLPYTQETFGPLLPLIKFRTEAEAIAIANDTDFGLAGYACTRDLARAWRVSEALETGMVGINEGIISGDNTPFGGVKESGLGREGGHWGIEEYLEVKTPVLGLPTRKCYDPNLQKGDTVLITQGKYKGYQANLISGGGGSNLNPSWKLSFWLNGKLVERCIVQSRLQVLPLAPFPHQPVLVANTVTQNAYGTYWPFQQAYVSASAHVQQYVTVTAAAAHPAALSGAQQSNSNVDGLSQVHTPVAVAILVPPSLMPVSAVSHTVPQCAHSTVCANVAECASDYLASLTDDNCQQTEAVQPYHTEIKHDILAVAISELALKDDKQPTVQEQNETAYNATSVEHLCYTAKADSSEDRQDLPDKTEKECCPEMPIQNDTGLIVTSVADELQVVEEEVEDTIVNLFAGLSLDAQSRLLRRLSGDGTSQV